MSILDETAGPQAHLNAACCGPRRTFFSDGLWIEGEAEAQFERAASLPGAIGAFAMPDLHPGKGIPIGTALATRGLFYPHLAGNDLGCGVLCAELVGAKRLAPDSLSKIKWLRAEPDLSFWARHLELRASLWESLGLDPTRNARTIGGGNHFVEISVVVESHGDNAPLSVGAFTVMAHSGSRHLGEAIARRWTDRHGGQAAAEGLPESSDWLEAHDACAEWAVANRLALAHSAASSLGSTLRVISDTCHNAIERLSALDQERCGFAPDPAGAYLHRKGASKADGSLAALPGSRGDYSYLLRPLAVGSSGLSLAHGAGRKWKRSDCEGRLARLRPADLQKTKLGSRILCQDKALLYEEAPQAYKDCSSVMRALAEHGLAEPVAKLLPLFTIKI
jgi:release factor H-coupled RctB family protein